MHVSKVIEQLGYKPNEAKVYLTALRLGECMASDIATETKLPRTSVQVILDTLHADGLVNSYTKRRYKYWIAENPERFLIALREREAALQAVLPELSAMRRDGGGKPTIKVFSGEDEIKLIHDDMLATRQHILGIIPWDDWVTLFGKEYMDDFIETRVHRALRMRLLVPRTAPAQLLKKRDAEHLRSTRFLPHRIDIRDTIFIYATKVAIISLNKKQPTGIVIDDPDTARTMSVVFEELWNQSIE